MQWKWKACCKQLRKILAKTFLSSTYIADTPSHRALLAGRRCLVCLALYAQVHDMVAANRAVVNHNIFKTTFDKSQPL